MRKIIFTFLIIISFSLTAQDIEDVLRYSIEDTGGTARFMAMGKAFGALGGDLSSISVNPAGSAIFNNSLLNVTTTNYSLNNKVSYGNTNSNKNFNHLGVYQIGGAFVFKSRNKESLWKKITLAINYDRTRYFNNRMLIKGESTHGIDNYFLNEAQELVFKDISIMNGQSTIDAYFEIGGTENLGFRGQQAFLGYYSGIIRRNGDENSDRYTSNASYSSVNQTYRENSSGNKNNLTINFATQYKNNFYIGASINVHSINFEKTTFFSERGFNPIESQAIQYINYDNLLKTNGSGISLNAGAIVKLNSIMRLGLSYQSPTWYRLEDNISQQIGTNIDVDNANITNIDFNIINIFPEYFITSPQRITGSLAFIFGKQGIVSFDYSRQNFSKSRISDTDNSTTFDSLNNFITAQLLDVEDFRIGGEYRLKKYSFRGGYNYKTKMSNNKNILGALADQQAFSFGLGYSFDNMRIDFGYNHTKQTSKKELFVGSNLASLNQVRDLFSLGLVVNF